MAKRKAKDITEQEWQEIIEYAKANTITAASVKFNVYADSIKYKIDPSLREKAKQPDPRNLSGQGPSILLPQERSAA